MNKEIYDASYLAFRKIQFPTTDIIPLAKRGMDMYLEDAWNINDNGVVDFCLYYPNAKEVKITTSGGLELSLVRNENGIWKASAEIGKGIIGLILLVDGNETMSPFLPIGYGSNRAIHYLDIYEDDPMARYDIPHGTVLSEYFDSKVTQRMEEIMIYLPPSYFLNENKRFPVLYLQHGHGENEKTWLKLGKVNFIYDELIADKKVEPAIVVMCNGMYIKETDEGINLDITKLEDLLTKEIIPFIDNKWRTKKEKDYRAIAGLSMGSLQASRIAFKNNELFSQVGLFSGFVQDFLTNTTDYIEEELIQAFAKEVKIFFRAIGDQDNYMEKFINDDHFLKEKQVSCIRKIYEGQHEWNVWRKCFIDFSQLIFKEVK